MMLSELEAVAMGGSAIDVNDLGTSDLLRTIASSRDTLIDIANSADKRFGEIRERIVPKLQAPDLAETAQEAHRRAAKLDALYRRVDRKIEALAEELVAPRRDFDASAVREARALLRDLDDTGARTALLSATAPSEKWAALTLEAVASAPPYDRLRRVVPDDVAESQRTALAEARAPKTPARLPTAPRRGRSAKRCSSASTLARS